MPFGPFEAAKRSARFLSGRGTKTTNVLDGLSNIGGGIKDFAMSGAGMLSGGKGAALAGGASVGEWMRENMPQSEFTSGRGSGAAATSNARQNKPDPQLSSKPAGYYSPGGNPSGSGQNQAQQKPGMGPYQGFTPPPASTPTPTPAPAPSSRDTSAPVDPNGAGGKGTSMSYKGFMEGIGTPNKINVRDAFSSENLPGTASYGASFALNSGANQRTFGADMADGQASGLNISSPAMLNAGKEGIKSAELESNRQLAVDQQNFGENQAKVGVIPQTQGEKSGSNNSRENARLRARAAFLNTGPGVHGMDGLRAAEGEMGMISQGGKKFARDTGAESGLQEISQDAYRARMGGGNMTQAINDNPIASAAKGKAGARRAATGVDSQTAATEAPSDVENPAVIGEDNKVEIIDRSDKMHGARTNFTVPTNEIPKNLEGAAGQAYLKKLDARKLTR